MVGLLLPVAPQLSHPPHGQPRIRSFALPNVMICGVSYFIYSPLLSSPLFLEWEVQWFPISISHEKHSAIGEDHGEQVVNNQVCSIMNCVDGEGLQYMALGQAC